MVDEKVIAPVGTAVRPRKSILLLVLLAGLLVAAGGVLYRQGWRPGGGPFSRQAISAQTLSDEYGLRVNLVAVTAVGGLVDLRLKVLDAEKAKRLLQDTGDAPILYVGEKGTVLTAPQDNIFDLLNGLEDGGNIFLVYPNTGNAARAGMPVTVQFGDIRLEPSTLK
ncbi:MAG: hypothetical protein KC441_06200 [Anaerolineales bacterium]|nr:hypothetical protein [Anaerolineales bacterium]